jgi:hypothetical protein
MPNISTDYAREGTAAQDLAEMCLRKNKMATAFLGQEIEGFEVTEDMAEAVQVYVDAVLEEAEGNTLFIEQRFNLQALNPPVPMFGTADAVIWNEDEKRLTVMDLKYGAGVPVKVENSPQLSYYALGAMLAMEAERNIFPTRVRMVIVQPRYRHPDGYVRQFEIDAYSLRVEFAEDLLAAAHRTQEADAPLSPGEAQIGDILAKADLFKGWINSVQAYAQRKLENGGHVPGYKLVAKRATRKWQSEEDAIDLLTSMGLEDDDIFTRKLISPAQAEEKLGKKKAIKDRLAEAVVAVSSGNTIAPLSDKRPAVVLQIGDEFDSVPALDGFTNFE